MNATPEGIALNGPDHGDSRPIRGDLRPRPAAHADFSAARLRKPDRIALKIPPSLPISAWMVGRFGPHREF
jgi:hypothetical protein